MSMYTTPGGDQYNVVHYIASLPQHQSRLLRSLWADLLTAKAAADKAIALAVEGLALVDKLQAENACLRVEIADADQRIVELDEAIERADRWALGLRDELREALAEIDRLELVK